MDDMLHPWDNEHLKLELLTVARGEMDPRTAGRLSPEDILQSLYVSLCKSRNKSILMLPTDQLKSLLVCRTKYHAWKRMRHEKAQRRTPLREERLVSDVNGNGNLCWEPTDYRELDPSESVAAMDDDAKLLDWLETRLSPLEFQVLELSLEGNDKHKIATKVNRGLRQINRIFSKIRTLLGERLGGAAG